MIKKADRDPLAALPRKEDTRPAVKQIFACKRLYLLLCAPAALLFYLLAHHNADFAEGYAVTVYPVLSRAINFLTGLLPFSLAEIVLVLLVPGIIGYLVLGIVRLIRRKEDRPLRLFRFVLNPLAAAAVLFLCFMLSCGMNYGRYTFTQISGLEVKVSAPRQLESLCSYLSSEAARYREGCTRNDDGVMELTDTLSLTAAHAAESFDALNTTYPTLQAGYSAPKTVLLSRGMSYLNITGMFFPFTFEANVNKDVPAYNIPFTMCHELSHLRGYMREDEANFIAYLSCMESTRPDFLYSGTLSAFMHCINALYAVDTKAVSRVYAEMDANVLRDLNANNAYWKQFETPVADISSSVNDAYLQSNGQSDGVQSYGRMVDLMLAYYRQAVVQQ